MDKEKIIAITGTIAVALLVWYLYPFFTNSETQTLSDLQDPKMIDFREAANDAETQINLISPTPPIGDSWYIERIDFVKDEPLAYLIYQDTHNYFRLLTKIKTGDGKYRFLTLAVFEPESVARDQIQWKLVSGDDLAKNQNTVSYIYDQELNQWKESNN